MKIAITSLITRKVSPITFGGTEAFAYDLVENLVKRGHEITLYASSDSQTRARLVGVIDSETAKKEVIGEKISFPYYLLLARKLTLEAENYDLIHNNFFNTYFISAFSPFINKPIIHTIHNAYFSNPEWSKIINDYGFSKNEYLVFVSNYAQKLAGNLSNSSVIYNGVDEKKYAFKEKPTNENLFWLGRMGKVKGASEAIKTALLVKKPLVIYSSVQDQNQQIYFDEFVKPYIDNKNIILDSQKNYDDKINYYANSKVLLFPILWEEPFGLVMVESMACGTPVIAFARGAVPEVIKDGETGFIVNTSNSEVRGDWIIKKTGVEGLAEAIEKIYSLPEKDYLAMRMNCREHVEKNFTLEKMVTNYENLYKKVKKQT